MKNQEIINLTKETIINQIDYLINGEGAELQEALNLITNTEISIAGADPKSLSDDEFMKHCKKLVMNYANQKLEVTDDVELKENDVYVVWLTKVLHNNKALLSTNLFDGMYYEITFNGHKKEFYLDAYKKFENQLHKLEE